MDNVLHRFLLPTVAIATLLSAIILLITTPLIWQKIYRNSMPENMHYKLKSDAFTISDAYWQKRSYEEVNKSLHLPLLKEREIYHFEDVRKKIRSLIIPFILGVGCLIFFHFKKIYASWLWIWLQLFVISLTLGIWGGVNWRNMFRTLHWAIFWDDSWILPKHCYSLKLFPYAVWQKAGVVLLASLISFLFLINLFSFIRRRALEKKY